MSGYELFFYALQMPCGGVKPGKTFFAIIRLFFRTACQSTRYFGRRIKKKKNRLRKLQAICYTMKKVRRDNAMSLG